MMKHRTLLSVLAVLALIVIISIILFAQPQSMEQSKGTEAFQNIQVGANAFKVHEDLIDPQLAAETMAKLNQTAKQLIYHLNNKYLDSSNGMAGIKPQYQRIVLNGINSLTKNYKTPNLEENIPERSGGDTSYVIDKGATFAMCLRDPNDGNKIESNMNELNFVLFHEMSHLFTSTYGHDDLFWRNFRFILQEAVEAGLYTPINYKKSKLPYCGIVISYSPLFDVGLQDYRS